MRVLYLGMESWIDMAISLGRQGPFDSNLTSWAPLIGYTYIQTSNGFSFFFSGRFFIFFFGSCLVLFSFVLSSVLCRGHFPHFSVCLSSSDAVSKRVSHCGIETMGATHGGH